MSVYYRATQPYDDEAIAAANAAVAPETGGRRLTMGPEDEELRKKWIQAYKDAGGKVVEVRPGKKPTSCVDDCAIEKTVTARIVTVTFRSDHLDDRGKKLLKRASTQPIEIHKKAGTTVTEDSKLGDTFTEYMKPEWDVARGGSSDSHPISHTKAKKIKIEVEMEFTVTPEGQTASLTEVSGDSDDDYLTFEKSYSRTVRTQRITVPGLTSKGALPNHVDLLKGNIDWSVMVDGKEIKVGTTGEHTIYVTFDKPFGKMKSPINNIFAETGPTQIVTDQRLEYSVQGASGTGESDEQECVDAIFVELMRRRVGYVLTRRWENSPLDNTGITPKPSLHHYLWLCNAGDGEGECHNIAAAFALACRILGVKGSFDVGYMFPWPSRAGAPRSSGSITWYNESHPDYPKSGKSRTGKNILGKYSPDGYTNRYIRNHTGEGHSFEALLFLDSTGAANNFEGVAAYKKKALYAIGDDVFDKYSDPNDNATTYYADRVISTGIRRTISDETIGGFDLVFMDASSFANCDKPYPWKSAKEFRWEE
jgi:hypothetical protein